MLQPPTKSPNPSADFDHRVVRFPTRYKAYVPGAIPSQASSGPATRVRQVRVTTRVIRQVIVVGTAGRLCDVVEELDRAIQLALAEMPRGIVCDLSGVLTSQQCQGDEQGAVEALATAGRHVRDWPGIPVAVACPDPRVREALRAQPLGEHLIVTESLFSAVSAVLATATLAVQSLRLAPHPTAPRAARDFVTRTLLEWRMGPVIPFASLVVSELVTSSTVHAGTDIDLSVVWNLGALRLTVRDQVPVLPTLPGQPLAHSDLRGRRLTLIAGISRAFGVLPTADGGKVAWAVLDTPHTSPSTSPHRSASARQESLILNDARGLAGSTLA